MFIVKSGFLTVEIWSKSFPNSAEFIYKFPDLFIEHLSSIRKKKKKCLLLTHAEGLLISAVPQKEKGVLSSMCDC